MTPMASIAFVRSKSRGLVLVALVFLVSGSTSGGREVWTNSMVRGTPEPPPPVVVERVWPLAGFKEPVDIGSAPEGAHLFVMELGGKIFSIDAKNPQARPELVVDLRAAHPGFSQSFGLTFHPGFTSNHWIFVSFNLGENQPDGSRVVRLTLEGAETPRVKFNSEEEIILWPGGGHNGACLKFGSDGMLYISTGDSAAPNPPDPLNTGQNISDLLASILRIDVDHADAGLHYRIPADNPFVKTPQARPEVWAYGLRNPWKMSFEPGTSVLWVGDVGWELWEMIFRLDHGGVNCGWSLIESRFPVRPNQTPGPTPVQKPITDHGHEEAASITGGFFYRGARVPRYQGAYVYGDWETGKMWALRNRGEVVTSREEIARTGLKIISFGEGPDHELYVLDHAGGGIYAMRPNPTADSPEKFPHLLSETGLFASVKDQKPSPGVYPFEPNASLWTDAAESQRWAGIPSSAAVRFVANYWQAPRDLTPSNAVWARTVTLREDRSRPATARKVETQLLHYDGVGWGAYTYRWNAEQTDASLVANEGAEQTFLIRDSSTPGSEESIRWRFHSRAECLRCHNSWNGVLLGFQPVQLATFSGQPSEGTRLASLGLVEPRAMTPSHSVTVDPYDARQSLEGRARAYLHANCAHCHRESAGGAVLLKLNMQLQDPEMHLLDATPVQGTLGVEGARLVKAGDPLRSVLLYRFAKAGAGHMPYLGTRGIDDRGLVLLTRWIEAMRPLAGAPAAFSEPLVRARALIASNTNTLIAGSEWKALSTTAQGALALRIAAAEKDPFGIWPPLGIETAQQSKLPLVSDLLSPRLPSKMRRVVLGPDPDVKGLLARTGKVTNGEALFFAEGGVQCFTCHGVAGRGRSAGPDLSAVGLKFSREEMLQQLLHPSARIDPDFQTWVADLKDGDSVSGFLVKQDADSVVLREATGAVRSLARAQIRSLQKTNLSLMPEGLLENLTPDEAADLLEFLTSRK